MDLSIVIVNYRGWKHLQLCLNSLILMGSGEMQSEIIVVDNNSADGQLSVFKQNYPGVKFLHNRANLGFSNGCNLGARHANGKFLLFLNPDIIANAGAVFGMLDILNSHTEITLLTCRQQNNSGKEEHPYNLFPDLFTLNGLPRSIYKIIHKKELNERYSLEKNLIFPDWVSGSVVMISANDFAKTGGWSEDYWLYYEDVELCRKVYSLGGKVALSNRHFMIHNHGGATRINPKTAALTKAEVRISKHVYVWNHFSGFRAFFMHTMCIIGALVGKLLPALLSIPFFFSRKLRTYGRLYFRLLAYYTHALQSRTWLSPRSPNLGFEKSKLEASEHP